MSNPYNGKNAIDCDLPGEWAVTNGTVKIGDAVSAEKDGVICEGNVYMILPWGGPGTKNRKIGTIVIKDIEDGHYANWNSDLVTKL